MQWENWTSAAWSGGARSVAPARKAAEAAARYWLQGAVPLWTALESDWARPGMKMLIPPWESMVGSGWPGSPWLRMQLAHSMSDWAALSFGTVVAGVPLWVASVVVETLATGGGPVPSPARGQPKGDGYDENGEPAGTAVPRCHFAPFRSLPHSRSPVEAAVGLVVRNGSSHRGNNCDLDEGRCARTSQLLTD